MERAGVPYTVCSSFLSLVNSDSSISFEKSHVSWGQALMSPFEVAPGVRDLGMPRPAGNTSVCEPSLFARVFENTVSAKPRKAGYVTCGVQGTRTREAPVPEIAKNLNTAARGHGSKRHRSVHGLAFSETSRKRKDGARGFRAWLLALSLVLLKLTRGGVCVTGPAPFMSPFVHLPIERYSVCVQFLVTGNRATRRIPVQVSGRTPAFAARSGPFGS